MFASAIHLVVHLYRFHGKPDLTLGMHSRDRSRDGKLQLIEGLRRKTADSCKSDRRETIS